MARRYQQTKPPRFEIERAAGGERIRVRARRNGFVLLFLPVWLILWTAGGIAAGIEFVRNGEPFLALWLVFWAVGWLGAMLVVGWIGWGSEVLRVTGGDLEIGASLFGLTRARLYRGADIRGLAAAEPPPWFAQYQLALPILTRPKWGCVKFHYGARTVYAVQGLDEAEGRLIADWLRRRLPASVA